MTFHGKVEAVTDKGLTVNGEKVEGWMDAMTMSYDHGHGLQGGLHNVMVMPGGKSDNKKSK